MCLCIRFTMSAHTVTEPLCELELAEGMRPVPPEPELEVEPEPTPDAAERPAEGAAAEAASDAKPDAQQETPGEEATQSEFNTLL